MKKYKLTDQNMRTYQGFQWKLGVKRTTSGYGELCGPGYLHYYHHPLLAVLLNDIHAAIDNPRLFEIEAEGSHLNDNNLKGGCTEMTLIKEIELPTVTNEQRIAFGILCAKEVFRYHNHTSKWNTWADKWLSGEDRSKDSAYKIKTFLECNDLCNAIFNDYSFKSAHSALLSVTPSYNINIEIGLNSGMAADYAAGSKHSKFMNLIEIAETAVSKY